MQTAAARLSCTQAASAAECINLQATMGHKSSSEAILHRLETLQLLHLTFVLARARP